MAVRFVIGRCGSGKTTHCCRAIAQQMRQDPMGSPIYWLLPRQATFMAERQLTCDSGLPAFCRARIVSFDQLGREVLADCGGSAVPEITPQGRQMIIGHLLRKHQPQLRFFTSVAHQAGLAAKLDATFAELERTGKTPAELSEMLGHLESTAADVDNTSLLAKTHDLHLIYEAYSAYLGQDRLDPHRRLSQVLACLHSCSFLPQTTVYVDGFAQFSEYERRVLAELAKLCQHVEIALLLDPHSPVLRNPEHRLHDLSLFHPIENAYRRLVQTLVEEGAVLEKPLLLDQVHRFANPTLQYIEQAMFADPGASSVPLRQSPAPRPSSSPSPGTPGEGWGEGPPEGLDLIEVPDRRAETDAVARYIRDLVDHGLRLRQVAVLTRDLEPYKELIQASFEEHGISCFLDRRRTVAHHPLLQLLRAVFQIALHNWPHEPVMTLLKGGLAGLTLTEADELENYVLLHRIHGSAWASKEPWTYCRSLEQHADDQPPPQEETQARQADALRRRLLEPLSPFITRMRSKDPLPLRQIVLELFRLLEKLNVRQTLGQWIDQADQAGDLEQHGEHEQVWAELVELLDQMVDLLGEEPVTVSDFLEVLESGLEGFDLALTPLAVDQVLVGEVERTRTPEVQALILIGMNEGVFPRIPHEDSVLSDGERRLLRQHNIDVDPDTQRRLLDENLLGYIACTRSSQRLCLTRTQADASGRTLGPSSFWRRLQDLFPTLHPRILPRQDHASCDSIGTPRQLISSLMYWVRTFGEGEAPAEPSASASPRPSTPPWPALYQWLAQYPHNNDRLDRMRSCAWPALRYANAAHLSPDTASKLFASPLHASVSRIEAFATCPYRHFLRYALKLQEREDDQVTAIDLGNVYHHILEKLVRQMLQTRRDWAALQPQMTDEMIRAYAQEVGRTLRGELMLSTARNQYLLQRIEKTLAQVVAAQGAAAARGQFRPAFAELGFGVDGSALPAFRVRTPQGREVLLHGKVDRVDMINDSSDFAVIDYKLTGRPLALDRVYYGISLQLVTYLLVLQANGQSLAGRKLTPAAAFYARLLRKLEEVKHPDDALAPDDPCFDLQIKPRGIFDGRCIFALDNQLQPGSRSDVVQAHLKQDGQFGFKNSTDVAEGREFAALLAHVHKRLGQLADQILAGHIDVAPYWINRLTPCPTCEYRSICRFDTIHNRYRILNPMKREDVLQRIVEATHHG